MIEFAHIRDELIISLKKKLKSMDTPDEDGFTLLEGFIELPLHDQIPKSIWLNKKCVFMIGLVGNKTGRMYTFPLKMILPDIEI